MFLKVIYGFLRVGEITCKTTNSGSSVLQHQDLSFRLLKGKVIAAKLTLTNFKHNRSGLPFYIHILRQQGSKYCPVQALKSFCTQDRYSHNRCGPVLPLINFLRPWIIALPTVGSIIAITNPASATLTPRFVVSWVAGNQTHLKSTSVPRPFKVPPFRTLMSNRPTEL